MKKLMALAALTVLTACDYVSRSDFGKERSDRLYRAAMEDYRAGRLDAAIDGFEAVMRKEPSNASARFQLACLLQDVKADYLGAFCAYREYLMQHPESDKAQMARDRLAKCELELAKSLSAKHRLSDTEGLVREIESLKGDLRAADVRVATAEKESESLRTRVASLGAERERLLAIIKGGADDEQIVARVPSIKEAKDLLEEDGDVDRITMSADAAALRAEATADLSTGSSLLPDRNSATNVVRTAGKQQLKKKKEELRDIPETYVVQEGDTLYGIAKRYYGKLSAWKWIRERNKGLISADNRLHVGDTLRLPQPEE